MADNSSGTNGNSWTILTPEVKESGVESVGPLPEGPEEQFGTEQPDSKDLSQRSDFADGPAEQNNASESPQVTPLETNEDEAVLHASQVKDSTLSATPVENLTWSSDPEQQGASAGHPESEPLLNPDADSFSDSYTHISPSPESTLHPAASQDEEGLSAGEEKSEPRKTLREESTPDVEVSEEQENEGDGLRRRKVPQLSPVDHRDDDEEEEGEEEPFRPPQRDSDAGFSLNKCIFGAVILLGLGTIFFSGVLLDLDEEGDADVQELKNPELSKEWLNLEASKDTPAGVQPPEALEIMAKESQKIAILQAQLQEQEGELKAAQLQVEEGTKERLKREEMEVEIQKMRGELDKLPALQKELEQGNEKAMKDLEALPAMQKELELLKSKVIELTQSTDGTQAVTPPSDSVTPSAGHESEMAAGQGKKELRDKKVRKEKEGKGGRKDREEGKPWKDQGNEGKEPKKQKEQEKKVHQDEGKEWRVKGERKVREDKDEKEGKRGKKQEDGKRWKDTEMQRESKDEGKKRERKENDKRSKDSKAKREFSEESGKEDKKGKKEKPWQLDGGRWETKERKHSRDKVEDGQEWNLRGDRKEGKDKKERKRSGDKVEGGKEWNLRGDQKEGKDERDWKRGRQVGSNDKKEWKEKNAWKERNEQDPEKEQRSSKGEGKAHRKDARKGEKDHHEKDHHEWNGGKKEWKERADKQSSGKEKEWAKNREKSEDRKHKGDYEKNGEKWSKKDKSLNPSSDEASHHSYSDRKQSKDHKHGDYWAEQRERIRHYRGSTEGCDGVTACAHAEGLTPVGQRDFEALLLAYLTKLLAPENQASKKEELSKLVSEFFLNGVFVHDQIPFSEFVEDMADILEDMAEGEEDEEVEDEMEEFAKEAMEKFVLPDRGGNEDKRKGSGKKRVSG